MSENCLPGQLQTSQGEGLHQDLIDLIHDAVLAFDTEGTITFWNHSAEENYGWSRKEIIGQSLETIRSYWPDEGLDHSAPLNTVWEGELHHRHRNGSLLIFQSKQVMRCDEDQKSRYILSINRNITTTRSLETQVKAYTSELERSNAELENFARIASHDLREPLRMIGSYAKLLDRRYRDRLDEDGAEFLDFVVDGADRMSAMIRDMLNIARIGTEPIEMKPIDLNEILSEVLTDLKILVQETDAQIIVSDLPTVNGDHSQLRRVFQNLVENALKHRGFARPRISIDAERLLNILRIEVRDNGPGIDPEFRNRIFVPYARGRNTGNISGSGTGLAVARKIIQGHGGRIWVDSVPDTGATFYVTLPAINEGAG